MNNGYYKSGGQDPDIYKKTDQKRLIMSQLCIVCICQRFQIYEAKQNVQEGIRQNLEIEKDHKINAGNSKKKPEIGGLNPVKFGLKSIKQGSLINFI
ncbi:hypothetical protein [Spirosoma sp. KNUC1025]|uniref:hypothetical protein n=1 Tax=Spirosoma sp. KNUC1025 TaxID=2894082 RepID=UPI0038698707|nr:hypothetical protein LN737_01320 [Spirosoma sp. KNUC1025]